MSGLVPEFSTWMPKRATDAQEGTTPVLEVSGDKHPRLSRSEEEVQANSVVITVDLQTEFLRPRLLSGLLLGDAI